MMEHNEGAFQGTGGLELYYQCWRPEENARAAIAIIHGLGEHSGRYMNVVNYLVPRGYAIYAFDLRGYGHSPGQRGYINEWREFREDVNAFLNFIRQQEPDMPIFLLGHSLGGIIALEYCLRHPQGLRGVICSGPGIGENGISPFLWILARLLNRVWPRCSLNVRMDISNLSRDAAVVKALQEDPLVHSKGTPRLGMEVKRAVEWVHAHADDLRLPLLIVHGTADRLAFPEGSRNFIQKVTFPDKELREYEGGYHELYNDIIKEQVLADTEQWLEQHLMNLHQKKTNQSGKLSRKVKKQKS